jgi:hypothetical protein
MSELRARARVFYNALNFDMPVNFGQDGLDGDKYVDNLHGDAIRDPISLNNVGQTEGDLGDLEAARNAWREGLEIARRLSHAFLDRPRYSQDLAWIEARMSAPTEQS